MEKDIPHVLLDVRSTDEAEKGFIKGAVTLPAADIATNLSAFPPKDMKAPIIIYDAAGGDEAVKAARELIAAGYMPVSILTGGIEGWKAAGLTVETGKPARDIVYVPKPRPGEISIEEFTKLAKDTPEDVIILDVRDQDEADEGMVKGAMLIPDAGLAGRMNELPKDKKILTYCSTGVRAEMAYHRLKEAGYNVQFLNATLTADSEGNFEIKK